MRRALIAACLLVVPLLAIAGFATAGGGQSELDAVRDATAKYHDIDVARALHDEVELAQTAAYGGGTCIADVGGAGAMGIHLLLQDRLDGTLVPTEPEVLLYEKRNNGSYKLTGVEYVVAGGPQPELFGQTFADTNLARYGNPTANVWTLHAWIWKPNPSPVGGIFAPWNPQVSCG
jgi:hypothetical protein